MQKTALMAGTALASSLLVSTAMAHESRVITGADATNDVYELIVGFHTEPAFEDSFNGFQIFLYHDDGSSDGDAVNTRNGDLVNFTALEVMLLDQQVKPTDPSFASHVKKTLAFDLSQRAQTPRLKFGTNNDYRNHFRPTGDGVYAFRVVGSLQNVNTDPDNDTASTNTATGLTSFDETFVCGPGGSLDVDPTTGVVHSFNCVQDITPFPGPAARGYQDNRAIGSN